MKDNKKPRNDELLAEQASEQGLDITVDSNAKHRARITRFGHLRQQSKEMSNWLYVQNDECVALDTPMGHVMSIRFSHYADKLASCANFLLFRHYYTLDKYKLAGLRTCKKHMLCPFCSAIRASKQATAYHEKMLVILKENPNLKPVFMTLTVKNGDDLKERFNHLKNSFKTLQTARRKWLKRGNGHNELCKAHGIVFAYEITNKGKGWHPHLHMVMLVDDWIDVDKLSDEWKAITGDSHVVDVRRVRPTKIDVDTAQGKEQKEDYSDGFMEVFKYAMKFTELTHYQIWIAHETLSPTGRLTRLQGSIGLFRGVQVPDAMTDDLITDNAPFMLILYKFMKGAGYSVQFMQDMPLGEVSTENLGAALTEYNSSGEVLPSYIIVTDPDTGETSKVLEADHV
ncbi:protein rep [Psychrobacter sp.]|uniref:protein rep n=1 Tax=Psychrobacter sp. TaxID=56811 RepID=UPI002FDB5A5F